MKKRISKRQRYLRTYGQVAVYYLFGIFPITLNPKNTMTITKEKVFTSIRQYGKKEILLAD